MGLKDPLPNPYEARIWLTLHYRGSWCDYFPASINVSTVHLITRLFMTSVQHRPVVLMQYFGLGICITKLIKSCILLLTKKGIKVATKYPDITKNTGYILHTAREEMMCTAYPILPEDKKGYIIVHIYIVQVCSTTSFASLNIFFFN